MEHVMSSGRITRLGKFAKVSIAGCSRVRVRVASRWRDCQA